MNKKSAGVLLFRFYKNLPEVLLVHPGGPIWEGKDLGAWSIPKGEFEDDENPAEAAIREVKEELGVFLTGDLLPLSPVKLKSGKVVYCWALRHNIDPSRIQSNTFELEWPPRSGKKNFFPEVDKAGWFGLEEAKVKINEGQIPFINELEKLLV